MMVIFSICWPLVTSSPQCHVVNTNHEISADCSALKLTRIPNGLPRNITRLILHNNLLNTIKKSAFINFTELRYLDLSNNNIARLHVKSLSGLNKLQLLNLNENHFCLNSFSFTNDCLKNLTSLQTLYINRITCDMPQTYPDKVIGALYKLEELYIVGLPEDFGPGFRQMTQLRKLSLSGHSCQLPHVTNDTFRAFENGNISEISIRNCGVTTIDIGSFEHFPNLHTLNLACNNNLGFQNVLSIIQRFTQSLDTLVLDAVEGYNSFSYLDYCNICVSPFLSLRRLSLRCNGLMKFDFHVLNSSCLSNLQHFNIGYNYIVSGTSSTDVYYILNTATLKTLDISYFGHSLSPVFTSLYCSADNDTNDYFRHEPVLAKSKQTFVHVPSMLRQHIHYNISNSLEYIYANHFPGTIVSHGSSVAPRYNNLKYIDVSYIPVKDMEFAPKYYPNLQGLDLSYCEIELFPDNVFEFMPNLLYLNMKGNKIGASFSKLNFTKIFGFIQHLTFLDLSKNHINYLQKDSFKYLSALENLDLSHNTLQYIIFNINAMEGLKHLNLADNKLQHIDEAAIDQIAMMHANFRIDLSDNQFVCDCSTVHFIQWIQKENDTFLNKYLYMCSFQNEYLLVVSVNIETLTDECMVHTVNNLSRILSICGVGVFLVIVCGIIYCKRWYIRWHFYHLRKQMSILKKHYYNANVELKCGYRYHAFVAHNQHHNRGWVINSLMPKVEEEWELKLCVSYRDFLVGTPIADNIVDAIDHSRKTILILTNAFLESEWCEFELQMALVNGHHTLVVCNMEELEPKKVSHLLKNLLKTVTCIDWSDDEDGQQYFWEHLMDVLIEEQ